MPTLEKYNRSPLLLMARGKRTQAQASLSPPPESAKHAKVLLEEDTGHDTGTTDKQVIGTTMANTSPEDVFDSVAGYAVMSYIA